MSILIKTFVLTIFFFNTAFMANLGCPVTDPPQTVLRCFFSAIEQGDYDTARLYCTGNIADGYIMGETLESWCTLAKTEKLNMNTKVLNVDVYEDKRFARVVFEVHVYVDNTEKTVKLIADFAKRENVWLVDDIKEPE
jgi:hypothetical protein